MKLFTINLSDFKKNNFYSLHLGLYCLILYLIRVPVNAEYRLTECKSVNLLSIIINLILLLLLLLYYIIIFIIAASFWNAY